MLQRINEEIIEKVINGTGTIEDSDLVAKWFASEEGQIYLSKRIDKELYTDSDLINALIENREIPSDDIYRKIEKQLFFKKISRLCVYAAAILLPLIIAVWGLNELDSRVDLFGSAEYVDIYVAKGERTQIIFPDGSSAHLNSDSKLRYPKKFSFSDRKVYLDGEAYFEIEANKNRPFIVELDSASINVLGTSFNLEAYSSERTISVVLDKGGVNLQPHLAEKKYNLNPGEKMVYDKYDGSCIIMNNNALPIPNTHWKSDVTYLKDKPLQEVIKVLDRKYNVRFKVEDEDALRYSYTILISRNTPLDKALSDLEKIAPVIFLLDNDTVTVKIKEK